MTNTQRIQSNNAELREAIDMAKNLPDAGDGGATEDVTEEINEYTAKLQSLENAIVALENELEGKAAGGGDISYFTLINNTSTEVFVNGFLCTIGDSTPIPYNPYSEGVLSIYSYYPFDENSEVLLTWLENIEDENGDFFEEASSSKVLYAFIEETASIVGVGLCDPQNAINHTVILEEFY